MDADVSNVGAHVKIVGEKLIVLGAQVQIVGKKLIVFGAHGQIMGKILMVLGAHGQIVGEKLIVLGAHGTDWNRIHLASAKGSLHGAIMLGLRAWKLPCFCDLAMNKYNHRHGIYITNKA